MAKEKDFENKIKAELHNRGARQGRQDGGTCQGGAWFVKFFANAYTPSGWERFLQLLDDIQAGRAIDINDDNYIMK